jgi:WD40 repeat protein
MRRLCWLSLVVLISLTTSRLHAEETKPAVPEYNGQVVPILNKYCTGCHSDEEDGGDLALDSFARLMEGGLSGAAVVAGKPGESRLIKVLEKTAKPFMPPKGSEAPTPAEVAVLKAWIKAGAKGPAASETDHAPLVTPKIEPFGDPRDPVAAVAWSPDRKLLAVARYRKVEILDAQDQTRLLTLDGLNGNVNDVGFSADGALFYAVAGEAGLFGEVGLWSTSDWKLIRTLRGHRDCLYAAALSPDGTILATGGYDQKIVLWNVADGRELRTLDGHNGAVFDLDFHPAGKILASASGDRTVKLWNVADGSRLDTLIEPEKEQYAVAFSPDGKHLAAGGVDNRIRIWRISSSGQEGTNPILYSRFGHQAAIVQLAFSPDGKTLVSSAEDNTIKVWETRRFTQRETFDNQSDWVSALAFAPDSMAIVAGRLDGSLDTFPIASVSKADDLEVAAVQRIPLPAPHGTESPEQLPEVAEVEPNDTPSQATPLPIPGTATGVLHPQEGREADVDLFRFESPAGRTWIIETNAARQKSPADTKIEVLHSDGTPVERLLFRAVRDSYITFRPIDSRSRDVRVTNWEEMGLNQFLYMGGEVCKIFRMPQGPDSGIQFYGVRGQRMCYFDTSATVHAEEDPVYIVEAYPPGTPLIDNGLPVFTHYYTNDDDGERKLGSDSRLTFTAPDDGAYLVRVTDVRGFGGEDFKYSLTIREPRPDFTVSLGGKNPKVPAGSGQRITITLDRIDNFNDEVRIDIDGLPPGFSVASPVVVEADHLEARTVINAAPDAETPTKEQWSQVKVTATAVIHDREVVKDIGDLGEFKLEPKPKVIVKLEPDETAAAERDGAAEAGDSKHELVIAPGTTMTAMLSIERHDFEGELKFDVDNLPHGVIVDNIGLSGILIREGETHRQIFLTAADWVPETTRLIHAVSNGQGNQASLPITLHVRKADEVAAAADE